MIEVRDKDATQNVVSFFIILRLCKIKSFLYFQCY